jgi:hypothetical protein
VAVVAAGRIVIAENGAFSATAEAGVLLQGLDDEHPRNGVAAKNAGKRST